MRAPPFKRILIANRGEIAVRQVLAHEDCKAGPVTTRWVEDKFLNETAITSAAS